MIDEQHSGKILEKRQKMAMFCLLLGLVLVLFAGCGRRAVSSKHINTRGRSNVSGVIHSEDEHTTEASNSQTEADDVPEPADSSKKEPLVYTDTRVPHYLASNPKWEKLRFDWICQDGASTAWIEVPLDVEMYRYYRGLERYYGVDNFYQYVNDENNKAVIRNIVSALRDVANDLCYDDAAIAREIAKFVQDSIDYQYDSDTTGKDEYPRYPIETIYERQGDCEDTSILMAALLKEWGYEVGFLHLPGHVAVAIRTSDDYDSGGYYQIGDHRYLFIESTGSGWNIGDIPEEFMETGAQFYLIP